MWDQRSPEGYLKIMAILQKYIDQGISVNTSYNPTFFEDEKIPMSTMIQDLLMFYKYGGKQLYYFNTFDGQGEIDLNKLEDLPKKKLMTLTATVACYKEKKMTVLNTNSYDHTASKMFFDDAELGMQRFDTLNIEHLINLQTNNSVSFGGQRK